MSPEVSEWSFEEAIVSGLLQHGPDLPAPLPSRQAGAFPGEADAVRETAPPYGEAMPGGYRKRSPEDYDRALCLIPRDAVDFILATQPKQWQRRSRPTGRARWRGTHHNPPGPRVYGLIRSLCARTRSH